MAILSYIVLNAIVSIIFAGLLTGIVGRPAARNRGLGFFYYLVLLFLVNWAALWATPFGPVIYGMTVLPIIMVALGASLLLGIAALAPFDRDVCLNPAVGGGKRSTLMDSGSSSGIPSSSLAR